MPSQQQPGERREGTPFDEVSWLPSAHARKAFLPEADEHARRSIDTVVAVWPSAAGLEIPLGAVATVALPPHADPAAPEAARLIASLRPAQLVTTMRHMWTHLWFRHPFLVERAGLLHLWLDSVSDQTAAEVTELVHLLFRDGLLELGADPDRRLATDLIGRLMQKLRGREPKSARGAFHTPDVIANFGAEMLNVGVPGDRQIGEPAAGSGNMWRAQAAHLRWQGKDPAAREWIGVEIDPLSAAALAANALLWGLGDDVVIACADALSRDSGLTQAYEERDSAIARRNALVKRLTDN
ncbi:N-6 DNA methylase [Streptomyces spongiae]|uniref:N-6 DNA methylase n=1 Tax=Streptomyces spongiae TaxID=565072 RepID=A0A5N8XH17_9ACTN|nr:N-6 DNA methylase [Streptomyces spongiae]MPY58617.1 N-6 DNA methylase [Streptomyces spongiae]